MTTLRVWPGLLLVLLSALVGCGERAPGERHMRVMDVAGGRASLTAAGRVTERFYSERRFIGIVFPDEPNPSLDQVKLAHAGVVVQPVIRGTDPEGPGYVRCTVHTSLDADTEAVAARCEAAVLEVAASLGIKLQAE